MTGETSQALLKPVEELKFQDSWVLGGKKERERTKKAAGAQVECAYFLSVI